MRIDFEKFNFLVGDEGILNDISKIPALPTFSSIAIEFLNALSIALLKNHRAKRMQDIVSYAYWIRKSSVEQAKKRCPTYEFRMGRGVAFHIAPSNVPVNFAVSMTSSILAGNASVVRVSSKDFEQTKIICDAINEVLSHDFIALKPYFCIIRYEHDKEITDEISQICDIRVIWGGNRTISEVRQSTLPPRSIELTFADRYSIAIINAEKYLQMNALEVAKEFYTDTYYTDQNACSSPRIVVWMGESVKNARERFWNTLEAHVKENYSMQDVQSVDKWTSFTELSMKYDVRLVSNQNLVFRIETDNLYPELMDYKNGGGYFLEYVASDLTEVVPVMDKRCQTISLLGIDKQSLMDVVRKYGVRGVDRIVDIGQTMGLEFIWDGFHMIEAMSRLIYMNKSSNNSGE